MVSVRSASIVFFIVANDVPPARGILEPAGVMMMLYGVPLTPAFIPSVYCASTLFLNCPLERQLLKDTGSSPTSLAN